MLDRFFRWMTGAQAGEPIARLSERQALEIARQAAPNPAEAEKLVLLRRELAGGQLVWLFWTPGIGSTLQVAVDDVTGAVVRNERKGGR
jgi:hypothetical protein